MQEDTRKYGERYDRYVESFEPGLVRNDGSYVMPPTYEDFEAYIEAEAVRRWPLKIGDTIVYLDGPDSFIGKCYLGSPDDDYLSVSTDFWSEYKPHGVNEEAITEGREKFPTAMRLLPGENPPKDRIDGMAMIAREAKKHKWLENKQKWGMGE